MPKLPAKKPPDIIELNNKQIETLLKFGKINKNDIFYDLGCGRGKIVFLAFDKFRVKKTVGFEMELSLYRKIKRKIQKYSEKAPIKFVHGDFGYVDNDDVCMFDFSDATVVFNSLQPTEDEVKLYNTQFKGKKVRILKKDLPLVGYKPISVNREIDDFWFYLMKTPLSQYRIYSKKKWAQIVLQDNKATISKVYKYYRNQLKKRELSKKEQDESIEELRKVVKSLLPKR